MSHLGTGDLFRFGEFRVRNDHYLIITVEGRLVHRTNNNRVTHGRESWGL